MSSFEFSKRYPNAERGYISWNRDKTKYTHPSLMRLSQRLVRQKKWNFSNWQKIHKIKSRQLKEKKLKRDRNSAELIGIILGDGCLSSLPRTEVLHVVCNSEQQNYINHVVALIQKIFDKRPSVLKRKSQKAIDIALYKCNLSKKLNIPCGHKIKNKVTIPEWIKHSKIYSVKCLKGLFETDGSFYEQKSNYTCVIEFKNNCKSLLRDTYQMLKNLGCHPQLGKNYARLARKEEVFKFKNLISFRDY